jgi:hypothetical protein
MPHQIEFRSSLSPTKLQTRYKSSILLEQAHSHASSTFETTVLSVLHTTATACLKRIITKRLHEHFQSLSPEVVDNTLISIVDIIEHSDNNTNLLTVTLEDIDICQRLAIKVGTKWSETLQKQGYV